MSQTTMSIRVDSTLKKNFDQLCDYFGLSSSSALTIFMKTVVRERKIPFEIKADSSSLVREKAKNAFLQLREDAARYGLQDLSEEEITALINEVRNGKE